MKSLESELRELEQTQQATIELLDKLLHELEDGPRSGRDSGWNLIDPLESAVDELLRLLECTVDRMVSAMLEKVDSRRG